VTDKTYKILNDELETLFDKNIFFICGVIKSGTTWLERILNAHPEVVCKGEGHFASDLYKLLSEAVDTYNVEMPKKGKAHAHLNPVDEYSDIPFYNNSDKDYLLRSSIGLMMAKWLYENKDITTIKCIGDKTPSNLTKLPLLTRVIPESKFIHIIRDGRDVAVSAWNFNMNTDVGATIRQWGSFKKFIPWVAEAWANQIKSSRELGQTYGDRYIELRYEDLINDPHKEASRLFHYLKVDVSEELIKQCVDKCTFEAMSGGRKSGEEDIESFYRKGIAGDWKNHLNEELLQAFNEKAGRVLLDCGYDLEL